MRINTCIVPLFKAVNFKITRTYVHNSKLLRLQATFTSSYFYSQIIMTVPFSKPSSATPAFQHLIVKELHPTFGAQISGVDFAKPLDDVVFIEILAAIAKVGCSCVHRSCSIADMNLICSTVSSSSVRQLSMMKAISPLAGHLVNSTISGRTSEQAVRIG